MPANRSPETIRRLTLGLALAVLAWPVAAQPPAPPAPPAPTIPAADERPRITISWKTSTEVDNYGFFVMKGESADGPFQPANPKVIAGAGNSEVPRNYSYEDFDVVPGTTYHYYLDAISIKGEREKYSPVFSKLCCTPPRPKEPAKP
jgi:hypothetical protein